MSVSGASTDARSANRNQPEQRVTFSQQTDRPSGAYNVVGSLPSACPDAMAGNHNRDIVIIRTSNVLGCRELAEKAWGGDPALPFMKAGGQKHRCSDQKRVSKSHSVNSRQ